MKLLFCHDGPMGITKCKSYYSIGFNNMLFKRYEVISNDITVAMRVQEANIEDTEVKELLLSKKYHVLPCPNISSAKGILFSYKKCKKILGEAIKKTDITIIRLPSFIGNIAINECKKQNKPYLVELVGCPWDSLRNHSIVGKIIAPIIYIKTRRAVFESPYVIYVTKYFLQKRYPSSGKSLACSDVEIPNKIKTEKTSMNTLDRKKIVTLGTIGKIDIKYKGQEYVIKAISELKKKGIEARYSLVGPGEKSRLLNIAKKYGIDNSLEFVGPIPHDKVFSWLDKIDVYIQPSTTEGMPRSLIEAMSTGKVCIGSDAGGIPELLDSRYIFHKRKDKEIVEIIASLTYEECREQSVRNYNFAKNYSREKLQSKRSSFLKQFKREVQRRE